MDKKQIREFQKIYAGISKNLRNKKWKCIVDSCEGHSINSHLLQQNGILNMIAEDNHVIEVKPIDTFKWSDKDSPLSFKKVSVKKALSLNLFCNNHDTDIFKPAETLPLKLNDYITHILFSYRVICAEIRKKEHNIETYERLLKSSTLSGTLPKEQFEITIKGSKRGIEDLKIYKKSIEDELDGGDENYIFKVIRYPLIKVYCSAGFNIYETYQTPYEEIPLKYVFIHVIPDETHLNIIVGYHKGFVKKSIVDYVESWEDLSMSDLEFRLTDLFATRVENWGLSPEIYSGLDKSTEKEFIKYFGENSSNYLDGQRVDFNLFEGNNYGTQQ